MKLEWCGGGLEVLGDAGAMAALLAALRSGEVVRGDGLTFRWLRTAQVGPPKEWEKLSFESVRAARQTLTEETRAQLLDDARAEVMAALGIDSDATWESAVALVNLALRPIPPTAPVRRPG